MDGLAAVSPTLAVTARAKINLALHVLGRRDDGYHELESLVAFCDHGDRLEIEPGDRDDLRVDGRFAAGVPMDERNLVLKALRLARDVAMDMGRTIPPLGIRLTKNLPHAAGIGGGSADAAALLSWICDLHPELRAGIERRSVSLGADVPMCLRGKPARVRGIGEHGDLLARFPPLHVLLVNPGVPVSTPAVFAALSRRNSAPLPGLAPAGLRTLGELVSYLQATTNDLEAPARRLAPSIAEASSLVDGAGSRFTRMSGSGATVFGLFETRERLEAAAERIADAQPNWWICATGCSSSEPCHP